MAAYAAKAPRPSCVDRGPFASRRHPRRVWLRRRRSRLDAGPPRRGRAATTGARPRRGRQARRPGRSGRGGQAVRGRICARMARRPERSISWALMRDATGNEPEAAELYRKALYLDPNHHEALVHLALLLEKQGDNARAKLLRDRARRLEAKQRASMAGCAVTGREWAETDRAGAGRTSDRSERFDAGPVAINDCWNQIGVRGDGSCPELDAARSLPQLPGLLRRGASTLLDGELPAGYVAEWTKHFARAGAGRGARRGIGGHLSHRRGMAGVADGGLRGSRRTCARFTRCRIGATAWCSAWSTCAASCWSACRSARRSASTRRPSRLGESRARREHQRLLVIGSEGGRVVFPVDEVHGIHRFHCREN